MLREVARLGSFNAAAKALSFTPSAVWQQMKALEQEAGTPLFERERQGARLTQAGHVVLAHARAALEQLERGEAEVAAIVRGEGGQLRFGSFPTATASFVAQAVRVFRARHPDVELFFRDAEPRPHLLPLCSVRGSRDDRARGRRRMGSAAEAQQRRVERQPGPKGHEDPGSPYASSLAPDLVPDQDNGRCRACALRGWHRARLRQIIVGQYQALMHDVDDCRAPDGPPTRERRRERARRRRATRVRPTRRAGRASPRPPATGPSGIPDRSRRTSSAMRARYPCAPRCRAAHELASLGCPSKQGPSDTVPPIQALQHLPTARRTCIDDASSTGIRSSRWLASGDRQGSRLQRPAPRSSPRLPNATAWPAFKYPTTSGRTSGRSRATGR